MRLILGHVRVGRDVSNWWTFGVDARSVFLWSCKYEHLWEWCIHCYKPKTFISFQLVQWVGHQLEGEDHCTLGHFILCKMVIYKGYGCFW